LRGRTNSNLHASPLLLNFSLCCLHSEKEITAPECFKIKDLVCNILLAFILLREAKGSKTLNWNKVEKFFQEINNP